VTAGTIYAVLAYVWTYGESVSEVPGIVQKRPYQRFLDRVAKCPNLTNADGVIKGRGHNIPSLEWLTDEGRALVERRLAALARK
jgi:hypothetical protein